MLDDINILKISSAMARHAADRHQLIAQNIANADTNNFKAKDLEPFGEAYSRLSKRQDNFGKPLSAGQSNASWREETISGRGIESPNGNTVSIEDQMMRSIEAQQSFEAATTIYKKTIDILRTSLGRGA
ncbi:MAG: flagellar biosynthesis protein FlgB [Hyphococcus sp.]|nr:MAG: flagellar biosynthesis protein FlgB [Marinicaulis sp.]